MYQNPQKKQKLNTAAEDQPKTPRTIEIQSLPSLLEKKQHLERNVNLESLRTLSRMLQENLMNM